MKKSTTHSARRTTTAGSRSSETASLANLASLIMSSANESARTRARGWRANLTPEQLAVVDDVKKQWHATRAATGVSASHLARTIIAQMPDVTFPSPKGLAEWLIRQGQ